MPTQTRVDTTAIETILNRASELKEPWAFTGSTALALRGLEVQINHGIDITTTAAGAAELVKRCGVFNPTPLQKPEDSPSSLHRSWYAHFSMSGHTVAILGDYQFRAKPDQAWSAPHILNSKVVFILYESLIVPVLPIDYEVRYYQSIEQTPKILARVQQIEESIANLREKESHYGELVDKTISSYDRAADEYNQFIQTNDYFPLRKEIKQLAEMVAPGARVLDAGCGPGHNSIVFAQHGMQVEGIDLSQRMISIARDNAEAAEVSIDFTQQNLLSLDLPQNAYDIIFSSAVLFHIPFAQIRSVLESFYSILVAGGVLFFTVQYGTGNEVRYEKKYQAEMKRYFSYYTPELLTRLLNETGFSVEEMYINDGQHGHTWINVLARK